MGRYLERRRKEKRITHKFKFKKDTYNHIITLAHLVEQYPVKMCVAGSIPVCRLLVSLFGEFGHWLGPIVLSNLGQYCILRVTYNTIFYNFLGHNPEVKVRFFHSPLIQTITILLTCRGILSKVAVYSFTSIDTNDRMKSGLLLRKKLLFLYRVWINLGG